MTTTTDAKEIRYDRETKDYRASYEGNTIGWYNSYLEAETALDHYVTDLLRDTAVVSTDMAADRAEQARCDGLQFPCDNPATQTIPVFVGNDIAGSPVTSTMHLCDACARLWRSWQPQEAPEASPQLNTPVSLSSHASAAPVASGDILAMYRTAYGWSCVELDDRQVRAVAA